MTSDSMKDITNRIKQRRIELGYSYQDLAELTNMSKSTLQRYETGGIKNLPLDKLDVLAKALQTTPAHLMGWEEKDNSPAFETDEYKKFVEVFDKLTPENQKMIYNLAFLQAQQQNEEDKK